VPFRADSPLSERGVASLPLPDAPCARSEAPSEPPLLLRPLPKIESDFLKRVKARCDRRSNAAVEDPAPLSRVSAPLLCSRSVSLPTSRVRAAALPTSRVRAAALPMCRVPCACRCSAHVPWSAHVPCAVCVPPCEQARQTIDYDDELAQVMVQTT
jgi:hypothetical protein